MKHLTVLATFTLAIGLAAISIAADPPHQIELEDYFSLASLTGLAVSPDGATAAWTEMRWEPPAETRNTDMWVIDIASRESERLTFDPAGVSGIRFSSDGQWIYYGSEDADDSYQVWRLAPDGGTPQAVTRVVDGIDLWDLAGDDHTLIYTVDVEEDDDEWEELREEFPDLEYGHGSTTFSEVRVLDLKTWRARTVLEGNRVIIDLDLSKDGAVAAFVSTPDNELVHREGWSAVEVLDVASGEITLVTGDGWRDDHPSPYGWVDSLRIADDGRAVAFTVSFDGYPTVLYVAELTDGVWALSNMARPGGVSIVGGSMGWKPGSRDLVFEGESRARVQLYTIAGVENGSGTPVRALTSGDITVGGWGFDADGTTLVAAVGSPRSPANLFVVGTGGALDRLTNINPQVDDWLVPSIELVQWTAPDGSEVEGVLELPPGWSPSDGPLPLIVEIHGGPTASTLYEFRFWIYGRTLLPAKGYALLSPNYRGSTGYGDDFMTDLVGRENDIEVSDILAGVDAMIERGIADPDRLGVMGWSNGGFLTNALISATGRFKAASSGAGVLDQVVQWAVEDTPGHVVNFMGAALPWENPEKYLAGSPLYGLGDATTPTLIHVGGDDPRVPPAHSRGLFRALSIYLGVPTELIVYPGAHHGLATYEHRKAKMTWDLAWFEKYLGTGWTPVGSE